MAGHSKWSKIKHKKAKEDSKRGKLFTKLIKEISVCARSGGGDPSENARLRLLLEKAKEINMPQENSARAIKRGTGELPGQTYESYMYEGYGPSSIAVLVEVLTENKNRAIAELRHLFSKKGGVIAESGAVSWMFEKVGLIRVTKDNSFENNSFEDKLIETIIDFEIKDMDTGDNSENIVTVTCDPKVTENLKQVILDANFKIESSELEWVSQNTMDIKEADEKKAYDFLDSLEELDDVQNVYTNLA